jgi:hypothetical protein
MGRQAASGQSRENIKVLRASNVRSQIRRFNGEKLQSWPPQLPDSSFNVVWWAPCRRRITGVILPELVQRARAMTSGRTILNPGQ